MFLRRGKQFFRKTRNFWSQYKSHQKRIVMIAFFPVAVVLFLLGLSFNITRKTMVQKTQESAIFQAATSASKANRGIRAWIKRLDKSTLQKIRDLRPTKEVAIEPNDKEQPRR
jgi:sensor histidine kinase regulating citrate/malate metabolism